MRRHTRYAKEESQNTLLDVSDFQFISIELEQNIHLDPSDSHLQIKPTELKYEIKIKLNEDLRKESKYPL